MALKSAQPQTQSQTPVGNFLPALALLVVIISLFFFRSYLPGWTLFSNDGPLGTLIAQSHRLPDGFSGGWQDLNNVGFREGGAWPALTYGLLLLLGPVGYSKLYVPFALLVLGLGAWTFFRQLRLAPMACLLGATAAILNSGFFSAACWGVASHAITIGLSYFALAALVSVTSGRPWMKALAAGVAVGLAVADGADIAAIFSIYVAAFAVYHAWTTAEGPPLKRLSLGIGRVAIVAVFAGLIAAQSMSVLISTQIKGVAVGQQDTMTPEQRWDFATQWSLPKREALCLLIPGLFGYRLDTGEPAAFANVLTNPKGGAYWGRVGQAPGLDRVFEENTPPPPEYLSALRFTGGGNYTGVLVVLVAVWAALQALRKEKSAFSLSQRKVLWFFMVVAAVSLLLAFGRFAPFFRIIYALPGASFFRNPAKFTHVVNWAMIVLFAHGVHALIRQYAQRTANSPLPSDGRGIKGEGSLKNWWAKAAAFDRRWTIGCIVAIAASVLGWLAYISSRDKLVAYLRDFGPSAAASEQIASFSLREVGFFICFLLAAVILVVAILSGRFTGKRARWAGVLIGLFLLVDLGRANLPWIIYWDYQREYALNPVLDRLRQQAYQHRVTLFPIEQFIDFSPENRARKPEIEALYRAYTNLINLYHIEWKQHQFPYYNVQCLDYVQMPREPADMLTFRTNLGRMPIRYWQLTNTRYLLTLSTLTRLDPQHIFKPVEGFDLVPRPGGPVPRPFNQNTATNNPAGQYGIYEFTGALPRARLYSSWEIRTNAPEALTQLMAQNFDPDRTVVVMDPIPPPAVPAGTNQSPGTVEFAGYAPKHILLKAKANAASVLLLNDHFDPNWQVLVDGKPSALLRCNYLMRGVQVPAGDHEIEFRFTPPITGLYVSLAALLAGLAVLGFLAFAPPPQKAAAIPEAPAVRAMPALAKK